MAKVDTTENAEVSLLSASLAASIAKGEGGPEAGSHQSEVVQDMSAAPLARSSKCNEIMSILGNSKVARVIAVLSLTQAASLINLGLVQAPLAAAAFADSMAVMNQRFMMASAFLGILASPYFGSFTDRRGRRSALVAGILAGYWLPLGGLAAIGWCADGLWFSLFASIPSWFMNIVPVQWAMVSDAFASDQKQMGFAVVMTMQSLVSFLFMVFGFGLTRLYPDTPVIIVWYVLLLASMAGCIAACIPPKAVAGNGAQRSNGPSNPLKTLWAPVRLIRKSATLQALGAVAGLLTLSCKMLYSFTLPFCYQNLGILGEGHDQRQQLVSALWMYVPLLALTPVNLLVGVWSDRFGPSAVARIFIPVAALGMMMLALMAFIPQLWFVPVGGFLSALSHPAFVTINPLISLVVPGKHVGQAFGAMASCKAFANLIGPLVMNVVLQSLEELGRNDLYWALIIACGAVMLCAAPFTYRLHRLVRKAADAGEDWNASWVSAQASEVHPAVNVYKVTGAGKSEDDVSTAAPISYTSPQSRGVSDSSCEPRGVSASSRTGFN